MCIYIYIYVYIKIMLVFLDKSRIPQDRPPPPERRSIHRWNRNPQTPTPEIFTNQRGAAAFQDNAESKQAGIDSIGYFLKRPPEKMGKGWHETSS